MPFSIPNRIKFERAYKILINLKTSLEKKPAILLSKQGFYLIRHTLFLLQVFDSIEMAAEEFVQIPKHMCIRDQPHAAKVLLVNSIKHKKPQLSYLNRLSLNESTRTAATTTPATPVIPRTPESPIVTKAETNPQNQALLLTEDDDEGNEMEINAELSDALSTERILLQLQLMDEHKLKRTKKFLEFI